MIQFAPLKTFVSAGHNNSDPGAVSQNHKEADVTKIIRGSIIEHSEDKDILS